MRQNHRTLRGVKTLQQKTELCKHVRDISINKWYPSTATCRVIVDTIAACQATRTVFMQLGECSNVWPIVQAIKMLPCLEDLRLCGTRGGMSPQIICGNNQPTHSATYDCLATGQA